jgi:hypothetical protein
VKSVLLWQSLPWRRRGAKGASAAGQGFLEVKIIKSF